MFHFHQVFVLFFFLFTLFSFSSRFDVHFFAVFRFMLKRWKLLVAQYKLVTDGTVGTLLTPKIKTLENDFKF